MQRLPPPPGCLVSLPLALLGQVTLVGFLPIFPVAVADKVALATAAAGSTTAGRSTATSCRVVAGLLLPLRLEIFPLPPFSRLLQLLAVLRIQLWTKLFFCIHNPFGLRPSTECVVKTIGV